MKFPRKLILWLLTALLVVIVATGSCYRPTGARVRPAWLERGHGWQAFDAMDHSFSSPPPATANVNFRARW